MQARHPPSERRLALQQSPPQQQPQRLDRVQHLGTLPELPAKVVEHILTADSRAGLLGGPRRERAPIRARIRSTRHRRRQPGIALSDLQVANHRIGDRADPCDLLCSRRQVWVHVADVYPIHMGRSRPSTPAGPGSCSPSPDHQERDRRLPSSIRLVTESHAAETHVAIQRHPSSPNSGNVISVLSRLCARGRRGRFHVRPVDGRGAEADDLDGVARLAQFDCLGLSP